MGELDLIYNKSNYTGTITINREKNRNAITPEAVSLFHKYLDEAESDDEVRVIVITGAGDRAFCTGAQLGDGVSGEGADIFKNYAKLLEKIYNYPKPTIARVKGYCLAGGMGFMLSCDMVIASSDSSFGTPEINVGLWPMMIGALIFRNVNRKAAMEMILMGERMKAEEALAMGLITRVVAQEDLNVEIEKICSTLTSKSPIGIRIGKSAFNGAENMELSDALSFLSEKLAEIAGTEDAREGITAFIQKREPLFKGR